MRPILDSWLEDARMWAAVLVMTAVAAGGAVLIAFGIAALAPPLPVAAALIVIGCFALALFLLYPLRWILNG